MGLLYHNGANCALPGSPQFPTRQEDTSLFFAEQQRIPVKVPALAIFAHAPKPDYFTESKEIKEWWEAKE
jgi:hypothetical protein